MSDRRVHGTTHELPADRFVRAEQTTLTPLGPRPLYAREQARHRVVATDALVAISGSRYSVPVEFVGATVTVRELLGAYEIVHGGRVIARHARQGRHQVVMEREHSAGLEHHRGPISCGPSGHRSTTPAIRRVATSPRATWRSTPRSLKEASDEPDHADAPARSTRGAL